MIVVPYVQGEFLHVGVADEVVGRSATGKVVGGKDGIVNRVKSCVGDGEGGDRRAGGVRVRGHIWLVGTRAIRRIGDPRRRCRDVGELVHRGYGRSRDAGSVVGWINDPDGVVFVEEGLLVDDSGLDLVDPFDIGKIGPNARVGECAILAYGLPLQTRRPESANASPLG